MASPMVSPGAGHPPTNPLPSGAYYRRNYEADSQQFPPRSEHSRAPPTSVQMDDPHSVDATMAPPPDDSSIPQSKGKEKEISGQRVYNLTIQMTTSHDVRVGPQQSSEPVRPPRGNVRLVTALIEDNRINPPDHLLAEVYIRCWSGGRPDELWCDAKDLVRPTIVHSLLHFSDSIFLFRVRLSKLALPGLMVCSIYPPIDGILGTFPSLQDQRKFLPNVERTDNVFFE
jgi:hypothetical protein